MSGRVPAKRLPSQPASALVAAGLFGELVSACCELIAQRARTAEVAEQCRTVRCLARELTRRAEAVLRATTTQVQVICETIRSVPDVETQRSLADTLRYVKNCEDAQMRALSGAHNDGVRLIGPGSEKY